MVGEINGRVPLMCWIWWEDECFDDPPETEFGDEMQKLT